MRVLFAMGIPTTTDDSGYWLWFSNNWTYCVVPALLFGTLLILWLVRKIRTWVSQTPGSSNPPGALCQPTEVQQKSNGTVKSGPAEDEVTRSGGIICQAAAT